MNTEDKSQFTECDCCDAAETICGEVNERTLEDLGWYLGPTQTLCPEHGEADEEEGTK